MIPTHRHFATLFAIAGLLTLPSCTGLPNSPGQAASGGGDGACSLNQAAVGGAVGAAAGGGLGYAISHGSAAGTLIGALGGAVVGGFLGNEQDQRCQQAAQAQALAQASAYAAAHEADLPVETVAEAQAPDPVVIRHHKKHYKHTPLTELPPQTYTNSQTGTSGSEIAMTPYIDKTSGNECTNLTENALKKDGTTQTATVTKCRTPPDGPWQTAAG